MTRTHARAVAGHLPIPASLAPVSVLEMPNKLLFPVYGHVSGLPALRIVGFMMLGLGDIALPGLLMHYAARCDLALAAGAGPAVGGRRSYLWLTGVGYVVGVCAAIVIGRLAAAPQPALLYLLPATLAAMIGGARARGELRALWTGAVLGRGGSGPEAREGRSAAPPADAAGAGGRDGGSAHGGAGERDLEVGGAGGAPAKGE